MFFRRGTSHGQWLQAKIWTFSVGAVVALVGMALQNDWIIGLAALILAAGIALRLLDRGRESPDDHDDLDHRHGPDHPRGPRSD